MRGTRSSDALAGGVRVQVVGRLHRDEAIVGAVNDGERDLQPSSPGRPAVPGWSSATPLAPSVFGPGTRARTVCGSSRPRPPRRGSPAVSTVRDNSPTPHRGTSDRSPRNAALRSHPSTRPPIRHRSNVRERAPRRRLRRVARGHPTSTRPSNGRGRGRRSSRRRNPVRATTRPPRRPPRRRTTRRIRARGRLRPSGVSSVSHRRPARVTWSVVNSVGLGIVDLSARRRGS